RVHFFVRSRFENQLLLHLESIRGVKCFDYSASLQLMVTGGRDQVVRLWTRYVTTRPVATLLGHRTTILDESVNWPDRGYVYVFNSKQADVFILHQELRIWDISTHHCLKTVHLQFPCLQHGRIPEHGNFPFLLLSPPLPVDTQPHLVVGCKDYLAQVVTGHANSSLSLWDVETGRRRLLILNAHGEDELTCMTLDSSHRRLITGARNGTIKDLYVRAHMSWKSSGVHKSDILALCQCSALGVIATASHDGEVVIWRLETQGPLLHLRTETMFYAPEQPSERVLSLSSDQPTNKVLVSGDTHVGHISMYLKPSLSSQSAHERPPLLHCWRAHTGGIVSVEAFEVADRLFVLTASSDGSAGLWTEDGDHVGMFGQEVTWNIMKLATYHRKCCVEEYVLVKCFLQKKLPPLLPQPFEFLKKTSIWLKVINSGLAWAFAMSLTVYFCHMSVNIHHTGSSCLK
uniref:Uncharacterized protein n=1 Tax=Mastacembelus armatus TaxID=205130 RepID=A0A3Q3LNG2_9TELE